MVGPAVGEMFGGGPRMGGRNLGDPVHPVHLADTLLVPPVLATGVSYGGKAGHRARYLLHMPRIGRSVRIWRGNVSDFSRLLRC